MKKYLKPKSVAWWSGIALLIQGLAPIVEGNPPDMVKLSEGLGIIGLRSAM